MTKIEKYSMLLKDGYWLKDKVFHKILFKVIIIIINGKKFKKLVLVEIIVGHNPSKVGNNASRVGNNLGRVGSNLSRVGSNLKIGVPNLVNQPYCHQLSNKI